MQDNGPREGGTTMSRVKPHADAVTVLLMMGGKANEAQLQDAFKAAGIDRGALQYLIMMGYVKAEGYEFIPYKTQNNYRTHQRVPVWSLTPKGLELLA
jgi:hypothetical protein